MSKNLYQVNHQWSTRPADERFTSLTSMLDHFRRVRQNSEVFTVSSKGVEFSPADGTDPFDLRIAHDKTGLTVPTNWAFGQMASEFGGSAGYLRTLPAALAADCLNYQIMRRDAQDVQLLTTGTSLRAMTGPNYGRVYNEEICRELVSRFGDGVSGHWRVPGEWGKKVDVTKDNTTLYGGDRDMFVFLADEDRRIELPNRRNGQTGNLARGFFVWNSEVGSKSIGIAFFLFDYVCGNRIVWGVEDFKEIRVKHTVSAPHRWFDEITPAIQVYAESSMAPVEAVLLSAQQKKVDDLDAFLAKRHFSKGQVQGFKAAHIADENRPIETLWDVSTAITAYARGVTYQDDRVNLEREAGKILQLAA